MSPTRVIGILMLAGFAIAGSTLATCPRTNTLGATLLFPYFEVDLDNPTGTNTVVSINNAALEPVLVNVVLWSDWGLPLLHFNLYLAAKRVQPINLRTLLLDGTLPTTGSGTGAINGAPSCTDPLNLPTFDESTQATIRGQLSGQPHPEDGLCYSSGAQGPGVAVGYLTVDTINDCTTDTHYPSQLGYFESDGTGIASNRNVLWGDWFLVEGLQNAAQGLKALAIIADSTMPTHSASFYQSFGLPDGNRDQRLPLGRAHHARYFDGGLFDGGTDLLVWSKGYRFDVHPVVCGELPFTGLQAATIGARFRNEHGTIAGAGGLATAQRTGRFVIGTAPFLPESGFGSLVAGAEIKHPQSGVPLPTFPVQSWAGVVLRAEGRLSVGVEATCVD